MRKRSPNGLLLFVLVARSKGELPARASAPAQIAGWRLRGGSAVSPLARSILAAPTNLFAVAQANVQLRNPGGFNFANIYFAFGTAGETSTNHALPWQPHCWAELQPAGGEPIAPVSDVPLSLCVSARARARGVCVCVCHTHRVCVCVFVLRAPFHKGWMQGTSKVKPLLWIPRVDTCPWEFVAFLVPEREQNSTTLPGVHAEANARPGLEDRELLRGGG